MQLSLFIEYKIPFKLFLHTHKLDSPNYGSAYPSTTLSGVIGHSLMKAQPQNQVAQSSHNNRTTPKHF